MDLSASLSKLNASQKLLVIREAPQTVLPKLFKKWGITHLVFEKDTDAYARERDEVIQGLAREAGVEVIVVSSGRTLYDSDELVKRNGGKPTMSMAQVQHAAKELGDPARPVDAPNEIPDPGDDLDLARIGHAVPTLADVDLNSEHRTERESSYVSIMGPKNDFAVPTLSELGIPKATSEIRGGETRALSTLASILDNEEYVATFQKPNTAPTDFDPPSTTQLSPHLHFGSLSVRQFYWSVQEILEKRRKAKKSVSSIPTNLPGQLLFRDMYFGAQAALGHQFAHADGNPICRFIPWHLQSCEIDQMSPSSSSYMIDNDISQTHFLRWKNGLTGFPFIDALMRQLKHTGWIHHLGRHAVACFLTRGGCYIHWERGAQVFEEWLVDHETACNVGNWMWLSCTAFFAQFYRVYSPVAFGKKWDPEGTFVRKWVPELRAFDKKFVYEPWKASVVDQKRWGCRIEGDGRSKNAKDSKASGQPSSQGSDPYVLDLEALYRYINPSEETTTYPKPMFDFNEQRELCLQGMKHAYDVGMYGDDEKVANGDWRRIFDVEAGKEIKNGEKGKEDENGDGEDNKKEMGIKGRKRTGGQMTLDGQFGKEGRGKKMKA
ncbi:putative dna photolyase [Phaeomoniella chlamydospora]|uniref:Putative dna photolyase n=1 Tax=Phaeomoniella chlamydospora TaxID=158046 RepID=A0A0G2G9W9_PHACM|nr:putative dna photolyase [Phaeomoniella chlamydospora]